MLLIEASYHDGTSVQVLRIGERGYNSRPSDTPANAHYRPILKERPAFERTVDPGRDDFAASGGSIVLNNTNGELDGLVEASFAGWPIRLLEVADESTALADADVLLEGIQGDATWTWDTLVLSPRDRMEMFAGPASPALYAGDNVGPVGIEGLPEDLKGRNKARVFGACFSVPLDLLNAALLIYGCNHDRDGATAPVEAIAVKVGGLDLVQAGDFPSLAALIASTGLVINGDFASGTGWTAGAGWSITGGQAVAAAGSASDLSRAVTTTIGLGYIAILTVTRTAGSLQPKLGSTALGSPITASGTYVLLVTGAAGDPLVLAKDSAFAGAVDNVSLKLAGSYETCLAEGLAMLVSSPGQAPVTADIVEGATASDRTAGQIVRRLALESGAELGDIDLGAYALLDGDGVPLADGDGAPLTALWAADVFGALDLVNDAPCGLYIADGRSIEQAMVEVARSIDARAYWRADGSFSIRRFDAPGPDVVRTLDANDLAKNAVPQIQPWAPRWRWTLGHGRNWRALRENEVAGAVPEATRAALGQEYRTAVADDDTVQDAWPRAIEARADTLLANLADAEAEAERRLARDSVARLPLVASFLRQSVAGLELFDEIALALPRFGMGAGRPYRIDGIRPQGDTVQLTLWG